MDYGLGLHISYVSKKRLALDFKEVNSGQVLMGNNESCKIHGIGSVRLRMWDGSMKIINDVRFIPDLKRNLFSLGALDQRGFSYKAQNGTLKVAKRSLVVMKGILKQGLYVLLGNTIPVEANVVVLTKDQTEL